MAKTSGAKTCYYELLGLDRKCDAADIKSSYRKLALKMHPDKAHLTGLSVEEATKQFQQVQEAYSVLSDPQERTWYDAHREQILKGDDGAAEDPFKTRINLYQYFSTSCFEGFGDGAKGFYAVYSDLFTAIDHEEAEWEDADSDEDHQAMPPFGGSDAEYADVSNFYRHWLDFCSRKAFGHADKWNPKEAQNRQVRRAMEQENKKARQAAKKEFNAEVRQLVKFVQKRDPRVAAQKQQMKDNAEKAQRELAEKDRQKVEKAKEAKERKEAARLAEEARWAEAAAEKEACRARGELVSEDEADGQSEEEVEYCCEPCRKTFKSEKAFDQHARSKKHLQVIAKLRRELEEEMEAEAEDAQAEEEDLLAMEGGGMREEAPPPAAAFEPPPRAPAKEEKPAAEEDKEEEDDESDEDAFLARFAGRRPAADEPSSSEDEGEDEDEDAARPAETVGAGKRAQKKAQQASLLLEKAKKVAEQAAAKEAEEKAAQPNGADAETGDAPAAADGQAEGESGTSEKCQVCGQDFPSRSKLFQHIKATGHATLKNMPVAEATSGKKGKKKR
mmetsp:Transcript_492/g.1242  ORF Transcript_492/g.1242 Transcript_492/m.1242 type:complete len:559 (+) Transcript_492:108-1784(+)|eukprot:CAMPEP_0195134698 /NCGR_PEP_ID=MMETSP0448-20130528/151114_1 /TAXON_ID=66468 /ORGANISM="Heterocapsa triquestra, Strain CCMP 448" /LENGTH=558 /DNA_ID=CAMNT_0040172797 /DNA_START=54 /DNA_END=1730 /DNA_ORIENTATION=-